MKLNIGSLKIGSKTLENVSIEDMDYKDFLMLIEGNAGEKASGKEEKGIESPAPVKDSATFESKSEKTEETGKDYVYAAGDVQYPDNYPVKFIKENVPNDCVLGVQGIMAYAKIEKNPAKTMQARMTPYKKIKVPHSINAKGVANLYFKKDIDKIVSKAETKQHESKPKTSQHKPEKKKEDTSKKGGVLVPTPVKITDTEDGSIYLFPSARAASRAFPDLPQTYISYVLRGVADSVSIKKHSRYKIERDDGTVSKIFSSKKKEALKAEAKKLRESTEADTKKTEVSIPKTKPIVPPTEPNTWMTYNDYCKQLRDAIRRANRDVGKMLSLAYKEETNVWGIEWMQARKDYYASCGDATAVSNLQIAYWIENNEIYGTMKGTLYSCLKTVLERDIKNTSR